MNFLCSPSCLINYCPLLVSFCSTVVKFTQISINNKIKQHRNYSNPDTFSFTYYANMWLYIKLTKKWVDVYPSCIVSIQHYKALPHPLSDMIVNEVSSLVVWGRHIPKFNLPQKTQTQWMLFCYLTFILKIIKYIFHFKIPAKILQETSKHGALVPAEISVVFKLTTQHQ